MKYLRVFLFATIFLFLIIMAAYLGSIFNSFGLNLCYSEALASLSNQSKSMINSNDQQKKKQFETMLNSLPLNGYETDCEKVREIIK
ncbi:hypothetical protein [Acinetobacter colistiniresistens]|uniref:Uncharacterized protein n=1 Tax=Acinetobacter colistiniresistens TaxID=280145 RepID=S3UBZ3_9GAMM|nr:hypothetical protein [Acinetobacter colistiniresistens]EPG37002.1 hypothetical protein F907_02267 [Acinetobacter colistiniresistens]TVT82943.1 hypothetical protein FPV60_08470 [Acinetobacter colistiniresistens]